MEKGEGDDGNDGADIMVMQWLIQMVDIKMMIM